VTTTNLTEARLQAIVEVAAATHAAAVAAPGFTFAGATGVKARVNGAYIKLDEQQNGKSVYGNVGNPAYCCWHGPNRKWLVSRTTNKDANKYAGYACSAEAGLDAPQLVEEWTVWPGSDAGGWARQPTVTITNTTAVELNNAGADVSQLLTIADQNTATLVAQQIAAARAQARTTNADMQAAQLTAQEMHVALVRVEGGDGGGAAGAPVDPPAPAITVTNFEEGKYLYTYTVPPNAAGAWALEVLVGGEHVGGSPFALDVVGTDENA
jgi:hypothetical protein